MVWSNAPLVPRRDPCRTQDAGSWRSTCGKAAVDLAQRQSVPQHRLTDHVCMPQAQGVVDQESARRESVQDGCKIERRADLLFEDAPDLHRATNMRQQQRHAPPHLGIDRTGARVTYNRDRRPALFGPIEVGEQVTNVSLRFHPLLVRVAPPARPFAGRRYRCRLEARPSVALAEGCTAHHGADRQCWCGLPIDHREQP